MSIKKLGQDGEYHIFFHKKKFLFTCFPTSSLIKYFVNFCSQKFGKTNYRLRNITQAFINFSDEIFYY
jgi:hypothetical protein